ncbi:MULTISPECIES: hypothetical protein [unclassified Nocardioides]|uniref:hypothetical protein n=1 Tax=unclassified Nocardioides TaxID=2615069 RepID=UPI0009F0743B|nr:MULTISPECIES: hypothetical protein [unclassified Nocardioides]GAW48071.1 uncharacterized protein PD653B2_0384 [Nocardioides sp. PD653-B2]GAW53626.1 uncharacterized protein PD653_1027 [Nocardioides sp. PD653]
MSEPEDLTPDEEQVRRLLADARHTEPLPDDVAARLDAVLADLRDEDPSDPVPVTVVQQPADLAAARRRRRNVRSWLVAAAAVVVVGIGINQVTHLDVSADDSGSSADAGPAAAGNQLQSGPEDAPASSGATQDYSSMPSGAPVRLDPDRFGAQVSRLRDTEFARVTGTAGALSGSASAESPLPDALSDRHDAYEDTCPTTGWGRGRAVPVRYDGRPGVLVLRPVRGDTQIVDLFLCGSDHTERSITLPAP